MQGTGSQRTSQPLGGYLGFALHTCYEYVSRWWARDLVCLSKSGSGGGGGRGGGGVVLVQYLGEPCGTRILGIGGFAGWMQTGIGGKRFE